jgi:hypothetical protein
MRPLQIIPRHTITDLALSPDGRQLGIVQEGRFRLIDAITGAELARDCRARDVYESSPRGRHSLHTRAFATRLAEVVAGKPCVPFQTGWSAFRADFLPAEPATIPLRASTVYQYGTARPGAIGPFNRPNVRGSRVICDCALTADHRFAVGRLNTTDTWYSLCDLATEVVTAKLTAPDWEKRTDTARLMLAPDETRVVAVTPHSLSVYDLPPPTPLDAPAPKPVALSPAVAVRLTQPQPEPGVPPFAVLPCGTKILARGEKSRIELRDLSTGEILTIWRWGLPRVHALAVAADGLTAAAGGTQGRVVMWDLE